MTTSTHHPTTVGRVRKTFSLAAACLLALSLVACDDDQGTIPTPSPTPTVMPTAAPGRLVSFLGTGRPVEWNGEAPAQSADLGRPGPLRLLPDGGLLLTDQDGTRLLRLGTDNTLDIVANQASGLSLFDDAIRAMDVQGDRLAVLGRDGSLTTLPVKGGAGKVVARLDVTADPPGTPVGAFSGGLASQRNGWIAHTGPQVVAISALGKVTPLTLPVAPRAIASDEQDLLVVTTDSLVRLRNLKVVSRTPVKFLPGAIPVVVIPDQHGGAFIGTGGLASIVHVVPGRSSVLLAQTHKTDDNRQCGQSQPGDPMNAPFRRIKGLALRGNDLLIASNTCNRVYALGLVDR